MKPALTFPLLSIGRSIHPSAKPGELELDYVPDPEAYSLLHASNLKTEEQLGMTLIDRDGRCWKILSVVKRGLGGPWWWRLPGLFFGQLYRVEYELADLEPMSVEAIKDRVIEIVRGSPEDWGFDDDDDPEPFEGTLEDVVERIREAPDLVQVINELFDQHFV